ncbi:MAG TPA: sigma-70 family RNA polymerase sigma factor [Planctomycetota bacterium]|nr:sigma-70 family RNA polymerase sigma factor [Planctomycetota bacterium]
MWQKVLTGGAQAAASLSLRDAVDTLRPAAAGKRREGPVLTRQAVEQPASGDEALAAQALAAEVRRAQQGDEIALAELIENNRAWVRGIAYTVLGDAHLAEDAAQEVCVRVVKHLRGLDTPEAFRPWVYRMTRNVALSMAQRRERSPQPLSLDAEQLQEGLQPAREGTPGASLEEDEKISGILETIGRLPDIYREVLVLKHVQDLSYTEMSAILGVSVKSLEVRLVRARKLLQERLGRRFDRGRKRDPRDERE